MEEVVGLSPTISTKIDNETGLLGPVFVFMLGYNETT